MLCERQHGGEEKEVSDDVYARSQKIEEQLRMLIIDGTYHKGNALPSEHDLKQLTHESRNAIRIALQRLSYDGFLVRRRGIGTNTQGTVLTNPLNPPRSFDEQNHPAEPVEHRTLNWRLEPATAIQAKLLATAKNHLLIHWERLTVGSMPIVYWSSYLVPSNAIEYTRPPDIDSRGTYAVLESYGLHLGSTRFWTTTGLAGETVGEILQTRESSPILIQVRHIRDEKGTLIEIATGYYAPGQSVSFLETTR